MSFLPVVERQLRVLARRQSTYWIRAGTALGFLVLTAFLLWDGRWRAPTALGRDLFEGFSGIAFVAALLGGALATADSISLEKREGTLGLLFLTDLKGLDVVLGKLVGSGIEGLYVLGAALPVMAIALLLGGVTGGQVWMMAAVILNSMFFALAAGLRVSTVSRGARAAIVATVGLVAFFSVGLIAMEALVHVLNGWRYNEPMLGRIGPTAGLISAMAPMGFPNRMTHYWWSLVSTHLLAWAFLLSAARILPRVWQEKAPTLKQLRWREKLTRWSVGNAEERRAYRTRMLERNPVCWLDDRYRLQKSVLWGVFLAALTFAMWLFTLWPEQFLDDDTIIPSVLLAHGVLLLWLAFSATHRLAEDKRSGALELLLATPVSVREIVRGRLLALWRQFGWVFACVNMLAVLMFAGMVYWEYERRRTWGWGPGNFSIMVVLPLAEVVMFLLYTGTIAMAGQWFAMVCRNALVATVATLVAVVGLHWGGFLALFFPLVWLDRNTSFNFTEWHGLGLWFFLGLANCAFWWFACRQRLLTQFRRVAARVPLEAPLWQRMLKRIFHG
jgi:hypothetical protein